MKLLAHLLLIFVFAFALSFAHARAADRLLTHVDEVHRLRPDEANDQKLPVKLRGVVTFLNSKATDFKIDDGTAGVGVKIADGQPVPKVGDEVEVEGYTNRLEVNGHDYPHVHGEKIRVLGKGVFPKARQVSLNDVAEFRHYDQWVSVEGVVVMWMLNSTKLTLYLIDEGDWAVVHIRLASEAELPAALHGARVRVTGVNLGKTHSREDTMMIPDVKLLEILQKGGERIFDAPLVDVADVVATRVPMVSRVRVRGLVLGRAEGARLYVRQGEAAMIAQLQPGWLRASTPGIIFGDNERLPSINPGDEVELVGSVLKPVGGHRPLAQLMECHVRVLQEGDPPEPVVAALAEVAAGKHTWDFVQVTARLVGREQTQNERGQWTTTLNLESEGVRMTAYLQAKQRSNFGGIQDNDEVQVSGLVEGASGGKLRSIRMLSANDVESFGMAPMVRERQNLVWGLSAFGLVMFLGIWITTLSRSLRRQKEADARLREWNATLEDRVQDRTMKLEASQRELERALEQEKELGELKTRFVTMVSHEFRTPLGITMSAVELMRYYEDKLPGEQRRELCEDIYNATRNMAGLMEQVLVLGRVEAGKLAYRPVPLDLHLLVGKLLDESLSATNRKCSIRWQPENDLHGAVADESLLRHILGNLVTNAVKYSPAGSEVLVSARREGDEAVFEVIDKGIGIPAKDRAQLFEAFHRCSNVGDVPGTGLGLVIVKRCVEQHGGSIDFRSEEGRGTTFVVRLPVFKADARPGV